MLSGVNRLMMSQDKAPLAPASTHHAGVRSHLDSHLLSAAPCGHDDDVLMDVVKTWVKGTTIVVFTQL